MGPLHHGLGLEKRERKVGYGGDDPLSREVAIEGRSSLTRFDSRGRRTGQRLRFEVRRMALLFFSN